MVPEVTSLFNAAVTLAAAWMTSMAVVAGPVLVALIAAAVNQPRVHLDREGRITP
jgi:hypothetical protein